MSDENPIAQFLRWWARRCGRNWTVLTTIAAGIVAIYSAMPVIASLRFWTTRSETGIIAERVYPREIEEAQLRIIIIKERIRWLEALGSKMNLIQRTELDDFRRQLINAENKLTELSQERARFRLREEYR